MKSFSNISQERTSENTTVNYKTKQYKTAQDKTVHVLTQADGTTLKGGESMKQKHATPKKYRQNKEVKQHFHPRWLARAIVHDRLNRAGATGVNKVAPGAIQSQFAQHWRDNAEMIAAK